MPWATVRNHGPPYSLPEGAPPTRDAVEHNLLYLLFGLHEQYVENTLSDSPELL